MVSFLFLLSFKFFCCIFLSSDFNLWDVIELYVKRHSIFIEFHIILFELCHHFCVLPFYIYIFSLRHRCYITYFGVTLSMNFRIWANFSSFLPFLSSICCMRITMIFSITVSVLKLHPSLSFT